MVSNVPVRHILYFDTASERTEMKHFFYKVYAIRTQKYNDIIFIVLESDDQN